MDLVKNYLKLREEKDDLEKQVKIVNEKIKSIETEVIDFFIENGMSSVKVFGKTVSIVEKQSVKSDDSTDLVDWLTENGYTSCFNKPINPASFRSLFTKTLTEEERADIANHVEVNNFYQLRRV